MGRSEPIRNHFPVRAAIFDVGMVLLFFDFEIAVQKLERRCRVRREDIGHRLWQDGLVDKYDRGMITTHDFAQRALQQIAFDGSVAELLDAWTDIFTVNTPMIQRARRWKQRGIPIYLLSNTCEAHIEFIQEKYDIFQMFDGGVYSCREGCAKPEKIIYERLLQRYGLESETTLFLDDRQENIDAARGLNIQSIHYKDEETLAKALKAYGLD